MSTPYQGNPANITTPLAATINGATVATPIVIQTTTSHFYSTSDRVAITGVLGNTAANGVWTITVIDATHFSLNGSVGSVAYTSGGTASNQSLTPPFQIPSDGDTFNVASVNVALQMLADRTQYLNQQLTLKRAVFTSSGTWTAPAGCLYAILVGCGGGAGSTATTSFNAGGGGGAGAQERTRFVPIVPNTAYTVTLGSGGGGGTAGLVGGTGGSTTFVGGTVSVTMQGAYGGGAGGNGGNAYVFCGGGVDHAMWGPSVDSVSIITNTTYFPIFYLIPPGGGGFGTSNHIVSAVPLSNYGIALGGGSLNGTIGGTSGGGGTNSGTSSGGGAGGGGGAGPYGNGTNAGSGGNGNNAGAGAGGTVGTSAAVNTGAGGGGGGSGGYGSTSGGAGAAGGGGGSGQLTIYYLAAA